MTSRLHLTRRGLLAGGLVLVGAACTPSPVIHRPSPSGTPEFEPERLASAQAEVDAGQAWVRLGELVPDLGEFATGMVGLHKAHATVLLQRDALAGVGADQRPSVQLTPAPVFALDEASAITEVLNTSGAAGKAAEETLGERGDAWELLWASLSVSAQSIGRLVAERAQGAGLGVAPAAGDAVPRRLELAGADEAALAAVEALVSLRSAILAGIGVLDGNDPLRGRLDGIVVGVNFEIDHVRELHLPTTQPSAPPSLGVRPPQPLDSPAAVAAFVAEHFQAAGDRLTKLAAVSTTARPETLAQAAGHFTTATQLGAAPLHWPGWE